MTGLFLPAALVLSCRDPCGWSGVRSLAAVALTPVAAVETFVVPPLFPLAPEPALALSMIEFLLEFWKLRLRLSSLPQVATLMFIWSGRGILPCWRKIFR